MSFRKRSDIIGAPPVTQPDGTPGIPRPIGRTVLPGRGPVPVPSIPGRPVARAPLNTRATPASRTETAPTDLILKNPGVRPSLITSQPTVSTGGSDLDKILLHQGLPVGHSLLIEESGSTDFASVILRAFASQGIVHNRIEKDTAHAHVVVIGPNLQWSKDLPGVYKGSTKDQKKAKIAADRSKISVSNLTSSSNSASGVDRENDMKIAWRYGLNKKSESPEAVENATYANYSHQFDITQKLTPGPSNSEISFIPITPNASVLIQQLSSIIEKHPSKIVRIVIPSLLNPSIYPPTSSSPSFIFPLVHSLRALLRKHSANVVLIASLPLDLYPRDSSITGVLELLFDSVLHLQPFNQEMSQLIEKAYKNEPSKIQQGLVNIIKLPVLSEKGLMMIHDGEYAFKNGRKKFEIEEWGIPVEDDSKDEQQTTKNIEF